MTLPGRSTTIVVEPLERPQPVPVPDPRRDEAPEPREPEPVRA